MFWAFVKAGQRLADIHVNYEQQPEYERTKDRKTGEKLDYRVTKVRLSKDKARRKRSQFEEYRDAWKLLGEDCED